MKEYDEEGVAYVGIENNHRVRSQGGRSGGVLHQMRRVVSGNAQRVRSGQSGTYSGPDHVRQATHSVE